MKALKTVAQAALDRGRVTEETIDTLRSLVDGNKDGTPDTKADRRALKDIARLFSKAEKKEDVDYQKSAKRMMGMLLERKPGKAPQKSDLVGSVHLERFYEDCLSFSLYVLAPKGSKVGARVEYDEKNERAVIVLGTHPQKYLPGPQAKKVEHKIEVDIPSTWVKEGQHNIPVRIVDAVGNTLRKDITSWTFPDSDF